MSAKHQSKRTQSRLLLLCLYSAGDLKLCNKMSHDACQFSFQQKTSPTGLMLTQEGALSFRLGRGDEENKCLQHPEGEEQ